MKIIKTDDEWKKELSPEQYKILRMHGTEAPFSGKYNLFYEDGTYKCAACGNPIFASSAKFNSGCGWPSFDEALSGHVNYREDNSHDMTRMEVLCASCGSHLGHVFTDGPTASGQRYCINSAAMDFTPEAEI